MKNKVFTSPNPECTCIWTQEEMNTGRCKGCGFELDKVAALVEAAEKEATHA